MSDEKVVVSLLVQSAKHLKDGTISKGKNIGQPWHLWLITDSTGREMTTFWTRAQEFVGQEIRGVITPVVGKDKDGNPMLKSSFAPDPEWEKGSAPALKPASSLLPGPIFVPDNKASSFAAAYSKDIVVAMITKGMVEDQDAVARAALRFFDGFYAMITNPVPGAKKYSSTKKGAVVERAPEDENQDEGREATGDESPAEEIF